MDVKKSFLNGVVKEEVHMEQPLGFETHDRKIHVCKLKKALYGLKQELSTWYNMMDSFLMSLMKILTFATRLKMQFYTLDGHIEY